MMREDFCAFILTHGRPDRVKTYGTLRRSGYTGKIYIVIDDEDKTEADYRQRYGAEVLQFCKADIANTFDEGDNFDDRRAIIYARNACWDLAKQVGCRYFIQLDDDYSNFALRYRSDGSGLYQAIHKSLNEVFETLVVFLSLTKTLTVAMCQGGDLIGGTNHKTVNMKRKAMNSFVCDSEKPFNFFGRINEDVNTYVSTGNKGGLFFTTMQAQLVQSNTQTNTGGMSDIYLESGTYIKTFYSVMYAPSCVKVSLFGDPGR